MLRFLLGRPRTIRVPRDNGQFELRKVSVTKTSRFSVTRFVTSFLIGVCVLHTIRNILPSPATNKDLEKIKKQLEEARRQQPLNQQEKQWNSHSRKSSQVTQVPSSAEPTEAEQKEFVHLMLPIWIRRRKTHIYTENDPEWKAYAKFVRDEKTINAVELQIYRLVQLQVAQKHLPWLRHLKANVGAVHLDVIVPIAPPAIYEVPCLFLHRLDPELSTYGWRRLPDSIGSRMDRVFHPVILSKAFYAGCKEFGRVTYLLGKARIADQIAEFRERTSTSNPQSRNAGSFSVFGRTKAQSEEGKVIQSLESTRIPDSKMKQILPFLRGEYGDHESRQSFRGVVQTMTFKSAIESASAVFRTHWTVDQMRVLQTNNRNAIQFRGNIDLMGEKGALRCEVSAFYDIEANAMIGRPLIHSAYIITNVEKWHGTGTSSSKKDTKGKDVRSTNAAYLIERPSSKEPGHPQPGPPKSSSEKEPEE